MHLQRAWAITSSHFSALPYLRGGETVALARMAQQLSDKEVRAFVLVAVVLAAPAPMASCPALCTKLKSEVAVIWKSK